MTGEAKRDIAQDSGLHALTGIAAYYRIHADPVQIARELHVTDHFASAEDILRAARLIGLKARIIDAITPERLAALPMPALAQLQDGTFLVIGAGNTPDHLRVIHPITRMEATLAVTEFIETHTPRIILVQKKGLLSRDPTLTFDLSWFIPSILRYRNPLAHVVLASFIIQLLALITPLFFQIIIDKVLTHRSESTLYVLIAGLVVVQCFDTLLQYLRTYALNHTTNRIDVELGRRLFAHLLRLPIGYFETRPAGQTVARMRELENIRSFLTGQALTAVLDLLFTVIFVVVLYSYSALLALIVTITIPLYALVAFLIGPLLRTQIEQRFNRGALSQQFLVETVIGVQTVKAAAVEPAMRHEWEERLANYVRTCFRGTMIAASAQGGIQLINKLSMALVLLFGAQAVMRGELTIGGLVAFNMISSQVAQPVLRLSQLWQDFQQARVSVQRLGDILNAEAEPRHMAMASLPPPKGALKFENVTFRYTPHGQDVLRQISFSIAPGEVIGIVGPSGSGKSSLAKLIQRFYLPQEGQIFLDTIDLAQADSFWLRSHIGVVLQENLLFNRSLHDNIAFRDPSLSRAQVIAAAKLAGADEFIARLPAGYETEIEERGVNLSGGQRQRIAIARALITNPPILILDEATSALDYESERIIQNNMRDIVRGRTVIIIAHRLSTVRHADRIIGLKDGRIVESGTHDELVHRGGGLYAHLWQLQLQGTDNA